MADRVYLYIKTTAPTANDDSGDGYAVGDNWLDTTNDVYYKAIDVSVGSAVWLQSIRLATDTEALTGTDTAKAVTPANVRAVLATAINGTMFNGKISVTVSSNDLIVALKTNAGTDPSSTDPVYVKINGSVRSVTSALSVTLADATNWFDSGSSRFATKERDYFSYLGYRSASSAVVIGLATFPTATVYSDFSATSTNNLYGAFSTAPASTDDVVVIGRFAATLSAGAGYTWTVPTFTNTNLIQTPIYETRVLSYVPTTTNITVGSGTLTGTYQIRQKRQIVGYNFTYGAGSAVSGDVDVDLPFSSTNVVSSTPLGIAQILDSGTALFVGQVYDLSNTDVRIRVINASATYATLTALSSTIPMTWTTNDALSFSAETWI